jgi:hypothetical protein
MNSRGLRAVLLVGCIGLFSNSAIAQFTTTGKLFGNVTSVDDEPVPGAVVILKSLNGAGASVTEVKTTAEERE